METFTVRFRDDASGEIGTIGIPADSQADAYILAREQGMAVVEWVAHAPTGPTTTDEERSLAHQNAEIIRLLTDLLEVQRGYRTVKIGPRSLAKIRSAIGWQVFFALIAFCFLFPIIAGALFFLLGVAGVALFP